MLLFGYLAVLSRCSTPQIIFDTRQERKLPLLFVGLESILIYWTDKMCDYGASYGIIGFNIMNIMDTLYADHICLCWTPAGVKI